MKHRQAMGIAKKISVRLCLRVGLAALVLGLVALPPSVNAALDRHGDDEPWSARRATGSTFPFVAAATADLLLTAQSDDAVAPPATREAPEKPAPAAGGAPPAAESTGPVSPGLAAQPPAQPPTKPPAPAVDEPKASGIADQLDEWLARANRAFQRTVIPRLSVPTAGGTSDDAIARKLQEVKEQEQRAAAAKRAEDERKAAEAKAAEEARRKAQEAERAEAERRKREEAEKAAAEKAAEEAKSKEQQSTAAQPPAKPEDSARLAEEMRRERARLEAEADRIEAERKAAEARRQADARAAEEARVAEERRKAAAEAAAAKEKKRTLVLTPEPPTKQEPQAATVPGGATPPAPEAKPGTQIANERQPVVEREGSANVVRGPAVKRWVWRTRDARCRYAGRRITPPGRYQVARGDSLWLISLKHYRTGRLYGRIYRANRSIIRDPNLIYPCQRFFVPRRRA